MEKRDESSDKTQTKSAFRCPTCGGEFESKEKLDEHARKEHKG